MYDWLFILYLGNVPIMKPKFIPEKTFLRKFVNVCPISITAYPLIRRQHRLYNAFSTAFRKERTVRDELATCHRCKVSTNHSFHVPPLQILTTTIHK